MQTTDSLVFDKLKQLKPQQKQQVIEFIDGLLQKRTAEGLAKEILLSVSVWTQEDVDLITEAQKEYPSWLIKPFSLA